MDTHARVHTYTHTYASAHTQLSGLHMIISFGLNVAKKEKGRIANTTQMQTVHARFDGQVDVEAGVEPNGVCVDLLGSSCCSIAHSLPSTRHHFQCYLGRIYTVCLVRLLPHRSPQRGWGKATARRRGQADQTKRNAHLRAPSHRLTEWAPLKQWPNSKIPTPLKKKPNGALKKCCCSLQKVRTLLAATFLGKVHTDRTRLSMPAHACTATATATVRQCLSSCVCECVLVYCLKSFLVCVYARARGVCVCVCVCVCVVVVVVVCVCGGGGGGYAI